MPDHFDTRWFFLHECSAFTPSADVQQFAADLERFARRAEAAGKNDADAMIFEALVIFGKAGRDIDAERWTALALEVTAQVRQGDETGAASRLMPQGCELTHDPLDGWRRTTRLLLQDSEIAIEAQATARSHAAAMLAALFRVLSHHFGSAPGEKSAQNQETSCIGASHQANDEAHEIGYDTQGD